MDAFLSTLSPRQPTVLMMKWGQRAEERDIFCPSERAIPNSALPFQSVSQSVSLFFFLARSFGTKGEKYIGFVIGLQRTS